MGAVVYAGQIIHLRGKPMARLLITWLFFIPGTGCAQLGVGAAAQSAQRLAGLGVGRG